MSQIAQTSLKTVFLLVTLVFAGVPGVRADEFLGEDSDTEEDEVPAKKPAKSRKGAGGGNGGSSGGASGGGFSVSGGLGAGAGSMSGSITVGYGFNRFIGIDTSFSYYKFENDNTAGESYGPELDLVLRLANPTMVTPFIGAGPGYEKWRREYKGEMFDDGGSATANAFGGINIMLTKNFGIQGVRKQTTYLNEPPIKFSDRTSREERSSVTTSIGFYVTL